ncbi:MAG: DnaJ domain-containing protein [Alphaproteobacteria bacterium]|nr:DnaJ domain-containing protein [Alphaproteobacteria bacterium]
MWDFKTKSFLKGLEEHEEQLPALRKNCEISGCPHLGEYRAPKSRYDLRSYYWFCLDHVREYNKSWDYFKGMTPGEVEQHLHRASVWDRPTWRSTEAGLNEDRARQQIYEAFARGDSVFGDFSGRADAQEQAREKAEIDVGSIPHPTIEALAVMDLAPPIEWEEVKARYKTLAKKYHPDTNKNDKNTEERLKKINLAYSILKLSYQQYLKLDEE